MKTLKDYGIEVDGKTAGKIKIRCPQCKDSRKNKRDKSLSVNITEGVWLCHYCGWKGCIEKEKTDKQDDKPKTYRMKFDKNLTTLSDNMVRYFEEGRSIPQTVLTQMQITEETVYMSQTEKKENCIGFNYFENGVLINTKYRDRAKNFRLRTGGELIPYNTDAIRETDECIITEGEMDALSYMACGRQDVISVPNGAGSNLTYLDRFMETHFEDKKAIYIAADTDRKGLELRAELIRRLGEERCRIVIYGHECKDANEHLVRYGKESLLITLANAEEIPITGVFTADDVQEELHALYETGMQRGATVGLGKLDELISFETGRLMVCTGMPGDGKSEFIDEIVMRLNLDHGWRTAYFSPENTPVAYHLQKLMEKITGKRLNRKYMGEEEYDRARRYLAENFTSILPEENFGIDEILNKAKALVRKKGIKILVLDPYNAIDHQIPAGMTETQYISYFLSQLRNFATRQHCLVILVAHPAKMYRVPGQEKHPHVTLEDISGSAHFRNKADFGIVVERDDEAGVVRIHVQKVKFRHLGQKGTAVLKFNPVNGRYVSWQEPQAGIREPEVPWEYGSRMKEKEIFN